MFSKRVLIFFALITVNQLTQAAWTSAHGDSANTGFARVDTALAISPKQFAQLGPLAPGANPVIGADGTVYVGNLTGQVLAFHPNGLPAWTRQLGSNHGAIYASPVIGADGSVYVVSTVQIRDHRNGSQGTHYKSWLHKFTTSGGWLFVAPFPEQFAAYPAYAGSGATTAPPNIWTSNGTEVIMVPVVYKGPYGRDLRLIAFSTNGSVLANQRVTYTGYEVTGGSGLPSWFVTCYAMTWYFPAFCITAAYVNGDCCGFSVGTGDPLQGAGWALPGAAIWQNPNGGTPWIMVSDGEKNLVGYTFSLSTGFFEYIRTNDTKRKHTSPPVVLPDGHTVLGTDDGRLTFNGPNLVSVAPAANLDAITAAPTRLADGRLVIIARSGLMSVLNGNHIASQTQLTGASIASAAASCNHLFVASTDEFVTYDPRNMTAIAHVPWVGGGRAAPVIGPSGYVYAIASNSLFVFPPPKTSRIDSALGRNSCDRSVFDGAMRLR